MSFDYFSLKKDHKTVGNFKNSWLGYFEAYLMTKIGRKIMIFFGFVLKNKLLRLDQKIKLSWIEAQTRQDKSKNLL